MIRQFIDNKLYIVLIVSLGFSPNKKYKQYTGFSLLLLCK